MNFIPDPIPDICESLVDAGWNCPARAGAGFLTFGPMVCGITQGRSYRLGFLVEIPIAYPNTWISIKAAVERLGEVPATIIFDHKEAKHRAEYNSHPAKTIISLGNRILGTFDEQFSARIRQASAIPASLEECLVTNTKCQNWHYKGLRIDDVLTAHRLASPADRWAMYRRQANTPNTKLDLVDALSEYATMVQDASTRFDLSTDAGDMLIDRGDLEARPGWHYWE